MHLNLSLKKVMHSNLSPFIENKHPNLLEKTHGLLKKETFYRRSESAGTLSIIVELTRSESVGALPSRVD
jgi:hypothetical protein